MIPLLLTFLLLFLDSTLALLTLFTPMRNRHRCLYLILVCTLFGVTFGCLTSLLVNLPPFVGIVFVPLLFLSFSPLALPFFGYWPSRFMKITKWLHRWKEGDRIIVQFGKLLVIIAIDHREENGYRPEFVSRDGTHWMNNVRHDYPDVYALFCSPVEAFFKRKLPEQEYAMIRWEMGQ